MELLEILTRLMASLLKAERERDALQTERDELRTENGQLRSMLSNDKGSGIDINLEGTPKLNTYTELGRPRAQT